MTQDDYKLWTGETGNFNESDWQRIVAVASARLASFLCLDELPTDNKGKIPDDLQEVLANFICRTLTLQGNSQEVSSKHVRNFTINFKSTASRNAFADVAEVYGDILDQYSACGLGFAAEHTKGGFCGYF